MPADAARPPGRLKQAARRLKAEALTVWFAARDPRTPLAARVLAACVAAYAFSPIDLIPDVIPVLGLLDDLILIPAGIWLVVRMVPPDVYAECRARAAEAAERPVSRTAAAVIVVVWIAAAGLSVWTAWTWSRP